MKKIKNIIIINKKVIIPITILSTIYTLLKIKTINSLHKNNSNLTSLIRNLAIENSNKKIISGKEVFVIPAYNEQEVIENTIQQLLDNGYKNIIIINDGSTDNTRKILEEKFADKIILLNHLKNRGQGASLETGFEYIRRYGNVDYVITYDSDGQHNIKDLNNFYKVFKLDETVEVVLGSRFLDNNSNIPLLRKIILNGGKIFTLIVSGKYFSDVHNGYRVLKKSSLDKIKITMDGMEHASEIQDIIANKKIKFKEVPVNIKYTEYSLSKGQSSGNAINIAFKMIWYKFFK